VSFLTQELTLERAQLEIKKESGGLSRDESFRLKTLQVDQPAPSYRLSLGARSATSIGFKRLASKSLSPGTRLLEDVDLVTATAGQTKALVTGVSDTSAGAHITNDRAPVVMQPRRRLQVLDLVRVGETNEDAVEYARQSTFTNAADVVVEATSTTTGTKPEATIAFTKETAAVADYAVWVPATRRSLSDVESLRDAVDGQLTYAVRRKLEEAVVAAMVTDAGASQAKGADTVAIAALKLLTTLRNADVEPTAALLNPADYEVLRTMTTAYTSPVITVGDDGVERLYGVPLVVSASVPDDTALIADMQAVAVWLRSLNVYFSASHSDYFVRNLVAILADLRAASAVTAPAGVGKVSGWD
jgi:hypothetical protein